MQATDWKQKSIECNREKKTLKKKVKELTISRNEWKGKSIRHKEYADKLASELKKINDKLNEILH